MKHLKLFEDFESTFVDGILPPIDTHTGGDDNYPYYVDFLRFKNNEPTEYLTDVFKDIPWEYKIDVEDHWFFIELKKMTKEHQFDYKFHKQDIHNKIIEMLYRYNKETEERREEKRKDEEFQEIISMRSETFNDVKVIYMTQEPDSPLVRRFIKNGETEQEANQRLFIVKEYVVKDLPMPEDNESVEYKEWFKHVQDIQNQLSDFVENNNWKLWGY